MAKKYGFGSVLFFGAMAAAAGGVAAYLRRKEIERVVQDIADSLDAREEDGFFSADLGDEPVIHKVPMEDNVVEFKTDSEDGDVSEQDFADGDEAEIDLESISHDDLGSKKPEEISEETEE